MGDELAMHDAVEHLVPRPSVQKVGDDRLVTRPLEQFPLDLGRYP